MTLQQARHLHELLVNDAWVDAANTVMRWLGKPFISTKTQAVEVMRNLFQHLLDTDEYLTAASLQWGPKMFLAEPESVQRSFAAVRDHSMLLVMGASSLGKSYGIGAWMVLDYLRDPLYTSVKLAAVSEKHLKENLYPHVAKLVRACVIPCRYQIEFKESDLWMGVKAAGFEFGISGIAFKQSQEASGQFKGYKAIPVNRRKASTLGDSSRLRVLLDEAQNVPGGPFQDFNSLTASISGADKIKIVCAFNPENTTCKVVHLAEPEEGWKIDQIEHLYDYDAKSGWRVCRLDAKMCENIIQKKNVYENLQTYEGYLKYLKAGGDNSPQYLCFARGFPPITGQASTIIPPQDPQDARGEAIFIETPISLASVDLAFMGMDNARMAVARWGLASGWRRENGTIETFKDRLNIAKNKPRHVLQIDQILPMSKHDNTVRMGEEIMGRCKQMKIKPEWVVLDKTGIGLGTYSHLSKVWGDVLGVSWNEKATEGKIVSDDNEGADKQCDGVMSEMWWAFRRWLQPQVRAVLINPIIPPHPIHTQLTSRRYDTGRRGIKVEAKEDYKTRNAGVSPDESDALVMLVHLVRLRGDVLPGTHEEQGPQKEEERGVDAIKFQSVKAFAGVDENDSLGDDAPKEDIWD